MTARKLKKLLFKWEKEKEATHKARIKAIQEAFDKSTFISLLRTFPSDFEGDGICGSYTLKELFGTDDIKIIKEAMHVLFNKCKLTLIQSSLISEDTEKYYISYGYYEEKNGEELILGFLKERADRIAYDMWI